MWSKLTYSAFCAEGEIAQTRAYMERKKNGVAIRLLNFALLGIALLISLVFVNSQNKKGIAAACHLPERMCAFAVKVCTWQSEFMLPCRALPLIGCLNVPIYPQTGI